MNTRLEPPPVPPLSPSQRSRLRNRVLDGAGTQPVSHYRRWTVPAVAVAAVGAVIGGTLLAGSQAGGPAPGTPPVAGTGGTTGTTGSATPASAAVKLDRGPATAAQISRAIKACNPLGWEQDQAVWSRQVVDFASGKPKPYVLVLIKRIGDPPTELGAEHKLGLMACTPPGGGSAVLDKVWTQTPGRAEGLVSLGGLGSIGGSPGGTVAHFPTYHRARPEIARIESRITWKGGAGKWYEGVVTDGIAYTSSTAELPAGVYTPPNPDGSETSSVKEEIRAFDALGNRVPVK